MGKVVEYRVREGVALITVDNPPVNALSQPVRARIGECVTAAIGDDTVGAIVIQAEGRTFPAGADLRDFRAHAAGVALGEVCAQIENSPKPVIAAIHGTALGGGLELALACHYRLADAEAKLGLPDVALGLVPSAGASQRLPRLVGPRLALDMLIAARPVSAGQAARIGLVDKVVSRNLARAAFGSARNMIGLGTGPRPSRDCRDGMGDPKAYLALIEERRAALADDRRVAAHRVVDLVEAALLLPFEVGLELEHASFEDLVDSDQARGLRYAFLAERRTLRGRDLAGVSARSITRIGVIGHGSLASELVRACLGAKRAVTLIEPDPTALAGLRAGIEAGLASAVAQNRLTGAMRDAQIAALSEASALDAAADCDMVIDAADHDAAARSALFTRLGAATRPGTVLACAAPGADIEALAEASERRLDVVGLGLFQPIARHRLLEVICPRDSGEDLVATAIALAGALGKVPLLPKTPGAGIALPVFTALLRAALYLVDEGADPTEIDAAMMDYGFSHGPFARLDALGLGQVPGIAPEDGLIARMIARGWTGRGTGQGFYVYDGSGDGTGPTPGLAALIGEMRRGRGLAPRKVSSQEICGRCGDAMTNAGARLVATGVAARPSDIDVAMVMGFGFPRWRGGPMEAADLEGLLRVRNRLRGWAEVGRDADIWTPEPLFDELIKNGNGFDSLN
jgi:3-hydroxyacyl-CoA dehydrogenase